MGTRALVARANDDGTMTGTYVGYDGDPAYARSEIIAIINRDGIEESLDTIILSHSGWGNIFSSDSRSMHAGYGDFYDDMVYPVTKPTNSEGTSELFGMTMANWAYVFDVEEFTVEIWERDVNWVFRDTVNLEDFEDQTYDDIRKSFLKY